MGRDVVPLGLDGSGPVYGKLGDLYGRKIVLQAAIVIFLVGSALCGIAQNMGELIAFRALQGLGAGGLIVTTMAVVGDIFPPRDRGRYQGFFGAVFGISTVVGPLLGVLGRSPLLALDLLRQPPGRDRRPRCDRRRIPPAHVASQAHNRLRRCGIARRRPLRNRAVYEPWRHHVRLGRPSDGGDARARCRAPHRVRLCRAPGGRADPSTQPIQEPDVRHDQRDRLHRRTRVVRLLSPSSPCTCRSSKVRAPPSPGCSSRR